MSGRLIAYEAKTVFELPAIVAPAVASAPQQQSPVVVVAPAAAAAETAPQQQSPVMAVAPASAVGTLHLSSSPPWSLRHLQQLLLLHLSSCLQCWLWHQLQQLLLRSSISSPEW